jgi:hypothetical protein
VFNLTKITFGLRIQDISNPFLCSEVVVVVHENGVTMRLLSAVSKEPIVHLTDDKRV